MARGSLDKPLVLVPAPPLLRPDADDLGMFDAVVDGLSSPGAEGLGIERRFVGTIVVS